MSECRCVAAWVLGIVAGVPMGILLTGSVILLGGGL